MLSQDDSCNSLGQQLNTFWEKAKSPWLLSCHISGKQQPGTMVAEHCDSLCKTNKSKSCMFVHLHTYVSVHVQKIIYHGTYQLVNSGHSGKSNGMGE